MNIEKTISKQNEITIMATGHRPDKLNGYDTYHRKNIGMVNNYYTSMYYIFIYIIRYLTHFYKKINVVSGLAQGVDTIWAEAAIYEKQYGDISLIGISPFKGQEKQWPEMEIKRFNEIIKRLDKYIVIGDHYNNKYYQERNIEMISISNIGLSIWDGSNGGTGNCVRYGDKIEFPWICISPDEISTIHPDIVKYRIKDAISRIK